MKNNKIIILEPGESLILLLILLFLGYKSTTYGVIIFILLGIISVMVLDKNINVN